MAFTYDLLTQIGHIRLLIADTDEATALFSDEELSVFLTLGNADTFEAAAIAFETIIREKGARLSRVVVMGRYRDEDHAISDLLKLADRLRETEALTLQTGSIAVSTENLEGYAPRWFEAGARE